MAPRRAKSDFGLQGWIDTLGLKQIFLIYSASSLFASFQSTLSLAVFSSTLSFFISLIRFQRGNKISRLS